MSRRQSQVGAYWVVGEFEIVDQVMLGGAMSGVQL